MEPGTLLFDPATNQVGEYQDRLGRFAMLRPVGGGREWEADPAALRPATDRERIGAGVRAANSRTREAAELDPPQPEPGCEVCADLAGQRDAARAAYDRSAETDANVRLRQHRRLEHGA